MLGKSNKLALETMPYIQSEQSRCGWWLSDAAQRGFCWTKLCYTLKRSL